MGGDWTFSTECYYNIYKKEDNQLVSKEFSFGLDCLCPISIVSWYGMHSDDPQKAQLAGCISILRKDKSFMDDFYTFHDAQRVKYKICPRVDKGYYGSVDPAIEPHELWIIAGKIYSELNDAGYNQKAADVLGKAGLKARVNEVGHIAVAS